MKAIWKLFERVSNKQDELEEHILQDDKLYAVACSAMMTITLFALVGSVWLVLR